MSKTSANGFLRLRYGLRGTHIAPNGASFSKKKLGKPFSKAWLVDWWLALIKDPYEFGGRNNFDPTIRSEVLEMAIT